MAFVTANWNPMQDVFFRKTELFPNTWGLNEDFGNYLIAAAPYGGPFAFLKGSGKNVRPVLEIYSSSGHKQATVVWKNGFVVRMFWTADEDLLFPQVDGKVMVLDMFGEFKKCISFENGLSVMDAKVFHFASGSGIVILNEDGRFFYMLNINEFKIERLPNIPGKESPAVWDVVFQNGQMKIIMAIDNSLYMMDSASCTLVSPPGMDVPFTCYFGMAVSFNYKFLALFTNTGYVWMGASSLKDKLCDYETKIEIAPKQMVWCTRPKGKKPSVIITWDKLLMVVGNSEDTIQFNLYESSYLVPEIDGVRILSQSSHEFLHEVPTACEEVFKIASMAPGALLLEAYKQYEEGSQKADEYLREIKDQDLLPKAVEQCIEAAGHEHEPEMQKTLLRAASFGKCFLNKFPPDTFVEMCRDLRVLNAIRDPLIGIPLSYTQYKKLTISTLIDRLVLRKHYPLAIKICEYMKIPEISGTSRLLAHWACYKVTQKNSCDEDIARIINEKIGDAPGISYSEIATKAYGSHRTELAIRLLEYEPRSGEQVPLLLEMNRSQLALLKAIESGDSNLVYKVVMHLKKEMNTGDFFMTLRHHPVALSLYRQFCRYQQEDTLKDLFNQDDDHQELGNVYVRQSYQEKAVEAKVAILQNAVDEYNKAKNEFAAKATEEQIKLLRFQKRLQESPNETYLEYSLHDTVSMLILRGKYKQAEQLYKDFKIPDKRFWWLKISALAESGDWEELEKFSKSKKSPIGYLPFVEICMKHGNKYEAKKYLSKVTPEQKVKACLQVGELDQAADAAIERKNENELNLIQSKCTPATNSSVIEKINKARAQLKRT
ncbi:vacuolar protein sorting-associated protein 16 homolog [Protopterus annectens]|uniref:vacuolar protein sorting-associated protein 16 homolog n=1 Tax=Protopterus annectens TaxID=7888 RepID=UPI001CFAAB75|nr:vacuolar protein sorting-associated protein 16 homolog [Protopterus annectens]